MSGRVERRKHPRLQDKNISIKLSGDGINAITQSLDVSASGVYCKVDRKIPLMTRVGITLSLPAVKGVSKAVTMDLDGVVVREHAVKNDGKIEHYDIAIFFNTLMPRERRELMEYINSRTA
jgi:hypothetical protein